jgi:hypothetical protein
MLNNKQASWHQLAQDQDFGLPDVHCMLVSEPYSLYGLLQKQLQSAFGEVH